MVYAGKEYLNKLYLASSLMFHLVSLPFVIYILVLATNHPFVWFQFRTVVLKIYLLWSVVLMKKLLSTQRFFRASEESLVYPKFVQTSTFATPKILGVPTKPCFTWYNPKCGRNIKK